MLFRKRKEPSLGIFTGTEGGKAALFSEEGKEITVDPEKVAFTSRVSITGDLTQSEKKLALRDLRRRLDDARESIDLVTVWECFEGETGEVPFSELAGFYYADRDADAFEELSFFWSVDKSDVYFKRGEAGYEPRGREEAAELINRKEAEERRKEERENALYWARGVMAGHPEDTDGGFSPGPFIEMLRGYVIHLDKFGRAGEAKSFLSEIGIRDPEGAIEFLIRAGAWTEDEDPILKRFYVRDDFPAPVEEEAAGIASGPMPGEGFRDLTGLRIFSIDDENTEDIDDALSIEASPEGAVIGIHIANVAALVPKWGRMDDEASKRGETIYLPEKRIHMFPPSFISDSLSLVEGCERRALSLFIEIDDGLNIRKTELVNSVVRVDENMSYARGSEYFLDDPMGRRLRELALALRKKRLDSGALIVQLPQLKIRIGEGNAVTVEKNLMNSEAHVTVAEMMILMNRTAGKYLKDRRIPAVYRSQPEPVPDEPRELDPEDPLYPVRIVKFLRAPRVGLVPDVHTSLGIDVYTQVTSPIRRYADLVMQRQIVSDITDGEPMYTEEELENLYPMREVGIRDKRTIERQRERYWLYKHLKTLEGSAIDGVVSSVSGKRAGVYLPDYLFETQVGTGTGTPLAEGEKVRLLITRVDPLRRILTLVPV